MASSAHKQQKQLPNMHGAATSAPPPTPSTQPNNLLSTSSNATAADALSRLLHRHPPILSLPTRRSPSTTSPPTVSFSDVQANTTLFSSSSQLGFFQLTNHSIPSQLANSAESEALSLFYLPKHQKESSFSKSWPLGFEGDDDDDEEDDGDRLGESFCLDSSCSIETAELSLASLRDFTRALEKVGLEIIDLLCSSVGFENPLGKDDPTRFSSMMWISEGLPGKNSPMAGRFYPYIVGLQYQIRSGQKYYLLADSGWVSVLPQVESVMVTIGDIAQVWSNGKLKKVRGRPVASLGEGNSRCISMSLLVTLPMDSRVAPLLPIAATDGSNHHDEDGNDRDDQNYGSTSGAGGEISELKEERLFKSFLLEDYAWRVYHERLFLKDPLDRFRIKNF